MNPQRRDRPPCRWGACALYHHETASFELVHERQVRDGGTEDDRAELLTWLDSVGFPALRARLALERPAPESAAILKVEAGGFFLRATPARSRGCLFIAAWKLPS
jgi:hypothetical protein